MTKTLTLTSLVIAGLNALGIMTISNFTCEWPLILKKYEFTRLLTGFLVSNSQPMQGLMEIYMLYSFSKGIEEVKFKKNLPDYIFYYFIIIPIILIFNFFMPPSYSLMAPLLTAITFTWSIANYNSQVSFYFMPIKASILPVVSLGFRLLLEGSQSFYLALTGAFAAYVYNCIETKSFGPLAGLIKDTADNQIKSNRVGTVSNSTGSSTWYYSTGYLASPNWLRNLVSKLMGIDYNSSAFKRPYGSAFPPKKDSGNTTGGSGSSSSSTTGRSTGRSTGGFTKPFFKGEGRRLGSLD